MGNILWLNELSRGLKSFAVQALYWKRTWLTGGGVKAVECVLIRPRIKRRKIHLADSLNDETFLCRCPRLKIQPNKTSQTHTDSARCGYIHYQRNLLIIASLPSSTFANLGMHLIIKTSCWLWFSNCYIKNSYTCIVDKHSCTVYNILETALFKYYEITASSNPKVKNIAGYI